MLPLSIPFQGPTPFFYRVFGQPFPLGAMPIPQSLVFTLSQLVPNHHSYLNSRVSMSERPPPIISLGQVTLTNTQKKRGSMRVQECWQMTTVSLIHWWWLPKGRGEVSEADHVLSREELSQWSLMFPKLRKSIYFAANVYAFSTSDAKDVVYFICQIGLLIWGVFNHSIKIS